MFNTVTYLKQPTVFPAPLVLFNTLMTCALMRPCELCKPFTYFTFCLQFLHDVYIFTRRVRKPKRLTC